MTDVVANPSPADLHSRLIGLRQSCIRLASENAERIRECDRDGSASDASVSAENLLHYVALRREDLRGLHIPLAELGLSSLGRVESHVLANLDSVIGALSKIAGLGVPCDQPDRRAPKSAPHNISITVAQKLLERRATALLGPSRNVASPVEAPDSTMLWDHGRKMQALGRRIMVTLPTQAAESPALARSLIEAGMTCARINTAHDGPEQWEQMCRHVRDEAARAGVECRILMDLAGPKLRTGPIEPGPEVICAKPTRDALGHVVLPAELLLRPASQPALQPAEIPVSDEWLTSLRPGDGIELFDTRGRRRLLRVREGDRTVAPGRVLVVSSRTVYIGTGTRLRRVRPGEAGGGGETSPLAVVGRLPALPQAIIVRPGDQLTVSLTAPFGRPGRDSVRVDEHLRRGPAAEPTADSGAFRSAVLTCTLPEAFRRVKVSDPVWIDDGRVGAKVIAINQDSVELRVTHAAFEGDRIREDKGINLPETDIGISGLTADDIQVLPLCAKLADIVGLSFVQDASDVFEVRRRLVELGGSHVGTVLKIETRRAFENLPDLLLAALQSPCAGVMIARGDLAVEMGYDRLAEVQEEILWLCEAAHLPVIWATQVLESMAKKGRPSRAEVTDAAMGERAECVMLNKGPFIANAVRFLDDLMRRMQDHQSKKRPMLRSLSVARRFGQDATSVHSDETVRDGNVP